MKHHFKTVAILPMLLFAFLHVSCKEEISEVENIAKIQVESFLEPNQGWTSLGVYEFTNGNLTSIASVIYLYEREDTVEMVVRSLYSERLLKFNKNNGGMVLGKQPYYDNALPSRGVFTGGHAMLYADNLVYNVGTSDYHTEYYTTKEDKINLISTKTIPGGQYQMPQITANKNYAAFSNSIITTPSFPPNIMVYNAFAKKWDFHYAEVDKFQRPQIMTYVLEDNNANSYNAYAITFSNLELYNKTITVCKTNFKPSMSISGAYLMDTLATYKLKLNDFFDRPALGDTIHYNLYSHQVIQNGPNDIYFLSYSDARTFSPLGNYDQFYTLNYYRYNKVLNKIIPIFEHVQMPFIAIDKIQITNDGALYFYSVNKIYQFTAKGAAIEITPTFKQDDKYNVGLANFIVAGNTMYIGLTRVCKLAKTEFPQFELAKKELR